MIKTYSPLALFFLVLLTIIWGCSFILIKKREIVYLPSFLLSRPSHWCVKNLFNERFCCGRQIRTDPLGYEPNVLPLHYPASPVSHFTIFTLLKMQLCENSILFCGFKRTRTADLLVMSELL